MSTPPNSLSDRAAIRQSARSSRQDPLVTAALGLFIAVVLVGQAIAWVVVSGRGLDTTDEGYYLNVIAHPTSEVGTALWFGAVLHGPWMLVGQNVAALRLVGVLLTVLLGTMLGREVLRFVSGTTGSRLPRTAYLATVLAMGFCSLLVYAQVPSTPSYNTVALWALCLGTVGLVRWVGASTGDRQVLGSVMVGAGAAILGFAKPTSALLFLPVVCAVAALLRSAWLSRLAIAIASGSATTIVVLAAVELTPVGFVQKTRTGVKLAQLLGGHPHMLRWDDMHAPKVFVLSAAVLLLGTLLASHLLGMGRSRAGLVLLILGAAVVVAAAMVAPFFTEKRASSLTYVLTVVWLLPATAGLYAAVALNRWWPVRERSMGVASHRAPVACAILLLVVPLVYAAGTNTNYWTAQARAGVFWVGAAAVIVGCLHPARPLVVLPYAVSGLLLMTMMSIITVLAPYRSPALVVDTTSVAVGHPETELLVSPDASTRLAKLRSSFRSAGGTPSTKVLDLTGDSPGFVWALGALPAGQGWIIGGYPGSVTAGDYVTRAMGCRAVASTWVLSTGNGVRSLGAEPLAAVGLDLTRDYEPVATIRGTANGRPGSSSTGHMIVLSRPAASAQRVCRAHG